MIYLTALKMNESVVLQKPMTKNSKYWQFLDKAQIFFSTLLS